MICPAIKIQIQKQKSRKKFFRGNDPTSNCFFLLTQLQGKTCNVLYVTRSLLSGQRRFWHCPTRPLNCLSSFAQRVTRATKLEGARKQFHRTTHWVLSDETYFPRSRRGRQSATHRDALSFKLEGPNSDLSANIGKPLCSEDDKNNSSNSLSSRTAVNPPPSSISSQAAADLNENTRHWHAYYPIDVDVLPTGAQDDNGRQ